MKKKLLLHICCAPCAVYVHELLSQDYLVKGFFYNPNIYPEKENIFREKELIKIAKKKSWDIEIALYRSNEWLEKVKGYEQEPERGHRCSICFEHRLRETFIYAQKNNFDVVTSTLSISPYKSTKTINKYGFALAKEFNIEFLGENFKSNNGFNVAKKMAMELEIKHQNYCGCLYSLKERERRIAMKKGE